MQEMTINKNLTPREYEVVREIRKGYTNQVIAEVMGISDDTVKAHVTNIIRKMGVANRTQVAVSFTDEELAYLIN